MKRGYSSVCLITAFIAMAGATEIQAQKVGNPPTSQLSPDPVVEITAKAKASLVTITQHGRGDQQEGLGSGFIISENGWIATNQHVIGKSRPLRVKLNDGTQHEVIKIIATDPRYDLAIIQIDKEGLIPLPLGDPADLKQGQRIVVLGNPHGIGHSVVEGVLSAHREIDEVNMLQIAIPIEEGNSGGPVLDMKGKVQGIVTLKSAITDNLGFAHSVADLQTLIQKPNPIPIKNWLTIGRLDEKTWNTSDSHVWTQHAAVIEATAPHKGAGGRSLCLQRHTPKESIEFSAQVKLQDESGAAGIAFFSDGGDRHYGFYPSAGELRLVRFDGPAVYHWNILKQQASPYYRPKQWNLLKVQIHGPIIRCFVNGHQVFEVSDATYRQGSAGLCKFRKTEVSFKRFACSTQHTTPALALNLSDSLQVQLKGFFENSVDESSIVDALLETDPNAEGWVEAQHLALQTQLDKLDALRVKLHEAKVAQALSGHLKGSRHTSSATLLKASLHLAHYDNRDLDISHYLDRAESMAKEVESSFPANATPRQKTERLMDYLFKEQGFHGSRADDISDFSNSYMNEVLDDREGIPVSLSILFLDLAKRLRLDHVYGVSLPGRFMVAAKYPAKEDKKEDLFYYDLFDQGKRYTEPKVEAMIFQLTGQALSIGHVTPCTEEGILLRVLNNFVSFSNTPEQILRYLNLILVIDPNATQERMQRALLLLKLGQRTQAKKDLGYILDSDPDALDMDRLRQLYRSL